MVKVFSNLIKSMRPKHWIKNVVVFAALVFSTSFFDFSKDLTALITFLLFCLTAGSVYIVNDIADRQKDRNHPKKSQRPIASGELGILPAGISAFFLFSGSVVAGFYIHFHLGLILGVYFFSNLLYSFWLEDIVILDVLIISFGFALRAIAGAIAIDVHISPWLVISATFLALFLALNKRKAELKDVDRPIEDRDETTPYTLAYLDQLIEIVTAVIIISYSLYSFISIHSDQLLWTIPFVIYGVFRYLYLTELEGQGNQLIQVLAKDIPLIIDIVLWVAAVTGVLIFF